MGSPDQPRDNFGRFSRTVKMTEKEAKLKKLRDIRKAQAKLDRYTEQLDHLLVDRSHSKNKLRVAELNVKIDRVLERIDEAKGELKIARQE